MDSSAASWFVKGPWAALEGGAWPAWQAGVRLPQWALERLRPRSHQVRSGWWRDEGPVRVPVPVRPVRQMRAQLVRRIVALVRVGVLVALLTLIGGCTLGQPRVVSAIEAAAKAVADVDSVVVRHSEGTAGGWLIYSITMNPETIEDAMLAVFDGRGYTIERLGSEIRIADAVTISREYQSDIEAAVVAWVPDSAIGPDGYPSK